MSVTSFNVANFIIKKCADENISLTPMKLQKLVYILYKEYLKETGDKLFEEKFMVWQYGPVVRKLYDAFKKFGASEIGRNYVKDSDGKARMIKLEGDLEKVANKVMDKHKAQDGVYLSLLTHQENTAWYKGKAANETYLKTSDIKEEFSF